MNPNLNVNFPDGNVTEDTICCAHCGNTDLFLKPGSRWAIHTCGCPAHIDTLLTEFANIEGLPERLDIFETALEDEPCLNDGHCIILSNSRAMCSPCRLKLYFFHCIYAKTMGN